MTLKLLLIGSLFLSFAILNYFKHLALTEKLIPTFLVSQDVVLFHVLAALAERDKVDPEAFRRVLPLHPPRPVHLLRQGRPRRLLQSVADCLQVGNFLLKLNRCCFCLV